jgi:hypothetical protein
VVPSLQYLILFCGISLCGAIAVHQVDLHGMKTTDAIACFIRAYDNALGSGSGVGAASRSGSRPGSGSGSAACLKVVHGYGSGGLGGDTRHAVRSLLKANPACADYVLGEDVDGNPGYTIVYPRRRLPSGSERLYPGIVDYCSSPKTKSDVVRRFVRRSTEGDIGRALRELENGGRLRSFLKNGRRHYVDPRSDRGWN